MTVSSLKQLLSQQVDLELAILIGSRAVGNSHLNSDWDIAIRWDKSITGLQQLAKTETLRRLLAKHLNQPESKIDLIDLVTANLTMKAIVADEGLVLKGGDSLAWNYFLQRTWRELESFYWNKIYVT